ncbi:MAG: thioredoxin reductase (NADPH) [Candidatus Latescibacterota bacterium]|jgi:thioredoxin reductase (NADPH)
MADVLIVGDGPGGLSAALFLAKNELSVTVFGQDETLMHKAMVYNYLGIDEITGSDFQKISRDQVRKYGGQIEEVEVSGVEKTAGGFALTTAAGAQCEAAYLILATGPSNPLAESLGVGKGEEGMQSDRNGRTAIDGLYVIGWSTRIKKIQAIISAGDGACAALDILSARAGEDMHDFDVIE